MKIKDISYFTRHERIAGNESGRSLVEMLGTIGIITMITVGAISGAGTSWTFWKANQTHEQVMEIIQGISDIYSWNRDGWINADFSKKTLCEQNDFSSCSCTGEGENKTCTIQLSLGSGVEINGGDGTFLKITVADIPYKAAQYLLGKADGNVITSIECSGSNCRDGSRGGYRTLIFTHDPGANE